MKEGAEVNNERMKFLDESEGLSKTLLDIKLAAGLYGLEEQDNQEESDDTFQIFPAHDELSERLRKSCYYGRLPPTDRPSLSLTQLAVEQFSMVGLHKLSRLDVARASEMSREACASPTSLVFALIYLDRLRRNNPDFLNNISSADLFLVSMMVASKFLNDDGEEDEVFNDEWAKSGQMNIKDFNRLEVEFLGAIDWNVNVTTTDFDSALQRVEQEIAYRELSRRSWSTYSDIDILSSSESVVGLWKFLAETAVRVTTVCMAAYAASLFTLLGSTALLNQTQFGPNGVADSYRTLVTRRDSSDLTARGHELILPNTADFDDSDSPSSASLSEIINLQAGSKQAARGDLSVTPAELLTASLLVASIKTADRDYGGSAWSSLDGVGKNHTWNNTMLEDDDEQMVTVPNWLLDKTEFIPHGTDARSKAETSNSPREDTDNTTDGMMSKIFDLNSHTELASSRDYVVRPGGDEQRQDQRVPDLHSVENSHFLLPENQGNDYSELETQLRSLALDWSNSVWNNLKTTSPLQKISENLRTGQCPLRNLLRGGNYLHPGMLDTVPISVL